MIAVSSVSSEGLEITPVATDELVYVSTDPDKVATPVTAHQVATSPLVLSDTTWRATDSTRMLLRRMLHETGLNPSTRIEVEDVETAVEIAGMGLADTVINKGTAEVLLPRLAPKARYASLRPRQVETLAIARRKGGAVSPATRLMIELATKRMQQMGEPVRRRTAAPVISPD